MQTMIYGPPGSRCAYICSVLLFTFAAFFAVMFIVWIIMGTKDNDSLAIKLSIAFLIVAVVMIALSIGIRCWLNKNQPQTPQGPLVSGSAPPGPVSGFPVQPAGQETYQPGYPQGAYYPQPSAPDEAYPLQPSPHDPNPSKGFDAPPPPSYDDLVKMEYEKE